MRKARGKKQQKDVFDIVPKAISTFKKNLVDPFFKESSNGNEYESAPLRAEIFTEQQLEQHARSLSAKHVLGAQTSSEHLLKRLRDNEDILLRTHADLTEAVKKNNRIVPAAE